MNAKELSNKELDEKIKTERFVRAPLMLSLYYSWLRKIAYFYY